MKLTQTELECLALGATILGSGGGGAANYNKMITQHFIEKFGSPQIMKVSDLTSKDCVVPIAFMGAPLVGLEKFPSGREISGIFNYLQNTLGRIPTALMPAEIGGANAFTPIWAASMLGLPVLDADLIGRAFPELQMSSCTIHGVIPNPAILCDCLGNCVSINSNDPHTVERIARNITVAMGSRSAVALYIMEGEVAKKSVVQGSVTQAITIGKALMEARIQRKDPCEAVLDACQGVKLASGIVTDINYKLEGGFLKGIVHITTGEGNLIKIDYLNEYLIATKDEHVLATTPDLIMLMEQEKGTPVPSSQLQFGLRVSVIALPAPEIWKTKKGLQLTGPEYFNFSTSYTPIRRTQ